MMELFRFTDQNVCQIMNCPLHISGHNVFICPFHIAGQNIYQMMNCPLRMLCPCARQCSRNYFAAGYCYPYRAVKCCPAQIVFMCSLFGSRSAVDIQQGLHNRSKRKSYKQIMDSCKSICTFKWIFIYDSTVDFSQ